MRATILVLLLAIVGCACVGCLNVRTPDVQINTGPPPEDIDSSKVPPTTTRAEARAELVKAYNHIRYLEQRNVRLRQKVEGAREDRDKYKAKYKRLKDRYDD